MYPCTNKCIGKRVFQPIDTNFCQHGPFPDIITSYIFMACSGMVSLMKYLSYFESSYMGSFPVNLFYSHPNVTNTCDMDAYRACFNNTKSSDLKDLLQTYGLYNEYKLIIFIIHISTLCTFIIFVAFSFYFNRIVSVYLQAILIFCVHKYI